MNRIQHCEYVNLGIIYGIANFLNGHSTEIYYVKIGEKLEFMIKIRPASNKAIISLPATSPPPKPPARHRLESSYSSILFTELRLLFLCLPVCNKKISKSSCKTILHIYLKGEEGGGKCSCTCLYISTTCYQREFFDRQRRTKNNNFIRSIYALVHNKLIFIRPFYQNYANPPPLPTGWLPAAVVYCTTLNKLVKFSKHGQLVLRSSPVVGLA